MVGLMPHDAITLADVREAAIEIFCEPFARRGRYNLERLIAKHGADIRLAELLTDHCRLPKARSRQRLGSMQYEGKLPSLPSPNDEPPSLSEGALAALQRELSE